MERKKSSFLQDIGVKSASYLRNGLFTGRGLSEEGSLESFERFLSNEKVFKMCLRSVFSKYDNEMLDDHRIDEMSADRTRQCYMQ